jgi:hypothetical protein
MGGTHIAAFEYLRADKLFETEKPYEILINLPDEKKNLPRSNLTFSKEDVEISDIRSVQYEADLDTHGFAWKNHATAVVDFNDRTIIQDVYIPEVKSFLKSNFPEANDIFVFDWRVSGLHAHGSLTNY